MKSMFKRGAAVGAFVLCALMSAAAAAKPVVVGSVNPATRQVTIFADLLVQSFKDGTPIQHIYGFVEPSNTFVMVRAGRSAGVCQTEALRLVRLSGNRLAISRDHLGTVVWDGVGAVQTLKKCSSGTCHGNCQVQGVAETLDLTDYQCHCSNATGTCQAVLPGDLGLGDVVQTETP